MIWLIFLVFRYLSKYLNDTVVNAVFKALNDANRRKILELLKDGDKTASEIADEFQVSKPSISHHLDLLKQANLVVSVKKGQFIYYSLNTTVIDDLFKWLVQFKQQKR